MILNQYTVKSANPTVVTRTYVHGATSWTYVRVGMQRKVKKMESEMLRELKTLIEELMKKDSFFDKNEMPVVTTNLGMMGQSEDLRVSNGFQYTMDSFSDENAGRQGFMACDVIINPRMITRMGKQDALWSASFETVKRYKKLQNKQK
tara:strand:- start:1431 stop:1874 length:444 start_codon:yes stop_codon:yes gene_type:complete